MMDTPFRVERAHHIHGARVPAILYGTAWKEDRTAPLTRLALESGLTGIDTANQRRHYHEAAVGEAMSAMLSVGALTREDVFLQTKFTYAVSQDERIPYDPKANFAVQVQQSFDRSLEHLQTDHVDSYLLHGPSRRNTFGSPDWQVWRAMEGLHAAGKTHFIGVSNVSLQQLSELCRESDVKPAFVQNRCFARTGWDRDIRAFCRTNGIVYQGFSLLTANQAELEHAAVRAVVARTGKTLAQVVYRFALQLGMIPLTGTTNAAHMREALACFDFELDAAQIRKIEGIAA